MIKAVFFDVGGVLIEDDSAGIFTRQARLLGIDRERLIAVMRPDRRRLTKGLIGRREYLRRISRKFGAKKLSAIDLKKIFPSRIVYYRQAWAIAIRLWRRGYIVGIITNVFPPHRFLPRVHYPFPPFRPVIQSFAVNAAKPQRKIFEIARQRAGIAFSEMIFFDDKPLNVAAAKRFGIKAFVYKNPAQLVRQLRRLGVNPVTTRPLPR